MEDRTEAEALAEIAERAAAAKELVPGEDAFVVLRDGMGGQKVHIVETAIPPPLAAAILRTFMDQ